MEDVWYVTHNRVYLGTIAKEQFFPYKKVELMDAYAKDKLLKFKDFFQTLVFEPLWDELELRLSKMCYWCGRDLTTPESIDAGVGPDCIVKYGPLPCKLVV